jgi:hypothetical protein
MAKPGSREAAMPVPENALPYSGYLRAAAHWTGAPIEESGGRGKVRLRRASLEALHHLAPVAKPRQCAQNEIMTFTLPGYSEDQLRILALLHPQSFRKMEELAQRQGRFVHYTSAAVAFSIIQHRTVWMRNARTMNDFSEVEHGKECLFAAYESSAGERLQAFLNKLHAGFTEALEQSFNGWFPDIQTNTFITCFSEHLDSEDQLGRLSMWRAYGRKNGVALVFNNKPFLLPSDALQAYSSPVSYLSVGEFEAHFAEIVEGIVANEELFASLGQEMLLAYIFNFFRFTVLCTKHPGFREEREWRVVYGPGLQRSDYLLHDLEVVNGIPQQVCKIPLKDVPEQGFHGAELPELLDRIIIGPSEHGLAMYDAFHEALLNAGVKDPGQKICVSDIPIREQ